MKNIYIFFMLIVLISCKTQNKQTVTNSTNPIFIEIDSISQMKHLKILASDEFMGRATGTKGSELSRNYIAQVFKEVGLLPILDTYFQEFTFTGGGHHGQAEFNKAYNVLGFIKGTETPEKVIVVGAHYDHLGQSRKSIFNGADDNASGTVALFSIAAYFRKNPPKKSLIIAAWDAEEVGLQGSRYYVNNPIVLRNNIVCNINMDMIGRNEDNELYISGTRYNNILKSKVITNLYTNKISILTGHDGADGKQDWTHSSDHAPFFDKGIPFLYFGVEDHSDYHKTTDDFEKIDPSFYIESTRIVIQAIKNSDKFM